MSHMTQTANPVTLLASPLGEEGHEVAKGWTVVILIMILDVDVTAEGGIIKLIARRAIQIKKAVKMAILKFHQWNELLKSRIQKIDKRPVTAMKIICKKYLQTLRPYATIVLLGWPGFFKCQVCKFLLTCALCL